MTKYILSCFLCLSVHLLTAQQLLDFELITSPGQLKIADSQITDKEGWTHFYNSAGNVLLLSVHAGEAKIGNVEEGMIVTSGLLGGYGQSAQDLSGSDYVEDTHLWYVFNRYFRIEKAAEIDTTLRIRFYYTPTDLADVSRSAAAKDEKVNDAGDLNFFTISEKSMHPFSGTVRKKGGKFTLHHPPGGAAPTWYSGTFQGMSYGELSVNSLNIGGGGGKYIKPFDGRFTAKGFVKTRGGEPLAGVEIISENKIVAVSDANGFYEVDNLVKNESYKFTPRLNAQGARGVTVLDMIYLQRGLKKTKLLSDPWLQLAADANYSDFLTASDLAKMRDAILHQDTTFGGFGAWQFVTKGYQFPAFGDPFKAGIPETHSVTKIADDVENLNFTAIKTGDLVRAEDFPNDPPLDINPVFELEDVVSCGTGDTVYMDLKVREFRRLTGFQFSLQWDEDILQFAGASDFNLSGLDENSFGFRYRNEGKLGIAWTTLSLRGTSVKDETVICRLKFLVNGNNGDRTRVEFKSYPAPIQILRDNFSSANALLTVGSVSVDNQSPLQISQADVRDISCNGAQDGAIALTVKGGSGKYVYKWTNRNTADYLTNLRAGKYRVTVYDGELCPLVSEEYTINEPEKLRLGGSQVFPIACPGATNGRIEVRVLGGTQPYEFKWSTGAITQNISALPQGDYALTVTDAAGCTVSESFQLGSPGDLHLNLSLSNETAAGKRDGALRINKILGGSPPYLYDWSNGGGTTGISGLTAGDYAVTIYDSEGCESTFQFTIENVEGYSPQDFTVQSESSPIKGGTLTYLKMQSPVNQSVTFKMFDMKSKQIANESLSLLRGENTHWFTAPTTEGTYLLQILPRSGGVQSLRIAVR